ncbi:unnamed protein product [Somion occarium]|uniref:Transmembrane protein n=1 Tax=Somion occarium TaxID=3059160 RepID=A0ABP1DIG0_9APHY
MPLCSYLALLPPTTTMSIYESVLSTPRFLWDLYVEYLWNYKPDSWVASGASTFRVLAFLTISPFIVLTLLDVISYVIARTLGVIDDTKAATSEDVTDTGGVTPGEAPIIRIQESDSSSRSSSEEVDKTPSHPPLTYFENPVEGEGNLKLSGVDMFSPAPSQPPSPTLSRRDLTIHMTHQLPSGKAGRARGSSISQPSPSSTTSSGHSSFAMLEKESESEDTSVRIRQRRGKGTGDSES